MRGWSVPVFDVLILIILITVSINYYHEAVNLLKLSQCYEITRECVVLLECEKQVNSHIIEEISSSLASVERLKL